MVYVSNYLVPFICSMFFRNKSGILGADEEHICAWKRKQSRAHEYIHNEMNYCKHVQRPRLDEVYYSIHDASYSITIRLGVQS